MNDIQCAIDCQEELHSNAGEHGSETRPPRKAKQPKIRVTAKTDVDEAIRCLGSEPSLYQRGGQLVTIIRHEGIGGSMREGDGSPLPLIRVVTQATLVDILNRNADWVSVKTIDGVEIDKAIRPPAWIAKTIMDCESWPNIRKLEGIVESPTLRPDGTIVDKNGWDKATAVYAEYRSKFKPIPPKPTRADAKAAAANLLDLVQNFPFQSIDHKAAWLAAALTPIGRFAVNGPCPLFLFDAPTPGTGKSMLLDVISILANDREMNRSTYREGDAELKKEITSWALSGHPMILLDNINTPLGGSPLEAALTSKTWNARVLGKSEDTGNLPMTIVWYGTGNNVEVKGDMARRVIPCRLIPDVEKPESRSGFVYPKLLDHVRKNRGSLVVDALTILSAHAIAGRPDGGLEPFGSFESWSDVIRSAVYWAIGHDPNRTREILEDSEPDREKNRAIVQGIHKMTGGNRQPGITAGSILAEIKDGVIDEGPRDAIMDAAGGNASAKSLGRHLIGIRDRTYGDLRLRGKSRNNQWHWWVEQLR